jgi:hypothetical protein
MNWIKWLKINHPEFTVFHIPNGGYRNRLEAFKFNRLGVLAGVFDLYCMDLRLFIEIKSKRLPLSSKQKEFKKIITETGHNYLIFYGYEDGIVKFTRYLKSMRDSEPHRLSDSKI